MLEPKPLMILLTKIEDDEVCKVAKKSRSWNRIRSGGQVECRMIAMMIVLDVG